MRRRLRLRRREVYPRVCGGTQLPTLTGQVLHGLSPRVRGNPAFTLFRSAAARSIPACAGEPGTTTGRR